MLLWVVQGIDISVQELCSLIPAHARASWTAQFKDEFPAWGRGFRHHWWLNWLCPIFGHRWLNCLPCLVGTFLQDSLCLSSWSDLQQTYVRRRGQVFPPSLTNGEVPSPGVRELQACKESARRSVLCLQACGSLTHKGGTLSFTGEVGRHSHLLT